MHRKLALHHRISPATLSQLNAYLKDFANGGYRVFRNGGRAYVVLDCAADVDLLREQFPQIVREEVHSRIEGFPW